MKKQELNVLYKWDSRRLLEGYSREDVVTHGISGSTIAIYGDKSHWTAFKDHYVLTVMGTRLFWKKTKTEQATFKDGKFYGSILPFREILLGVFHLDWINNNKWTLGILDTRKDIWKLIFQNRITNPEMLAKYFSKKYFKGVYSYRTLKEAFSAYGLRVSLWDLYYYTINPEENLKCLTNSYLRGLGERRDILYYAKILNEKVDFRWSENRLRRVHQEQIEKLAAAKADKYSSTPIVEPFQEDKLSLILDERSCFIEGNKMHNCVHSCYWRSIEGGQYLIARGEIDDEYVDFGIRLKDKELEVDQIHTMYNGRASNDTLRYCKDWLVRNGEKLFSIIQNIRLKELKPKELLAPPQEAYAEIPF